MFFYYFLTLSRQFSKLVKINSSFDFIGDM